MKLFKASKTVMNWSSPKKKRAFFVPFILSEGNFFKICFISMYSLLNTLQLHIKKHYFIHFCCLFLKLLKAFSVSLDFKIIYFSCLEPFSTHSSFVRTSYLTLRKIINFIKTSISYIE